MKETEKVSEAVQIARNRGLGVVIIDHNIGHVHRICDRIVIMEAGRVIRSVRRDDITAEHVADWSRDGMRSDSRRRRRDLFRSRAQGPERHGKGLKPLNSVSSPRWNCGA